MRSIKKRLLKNHLLMVKICQAFLIQLAIYNKTILLVLAADTELDQ